MAYYTSHSTTIQASHLQFALIGGLSISQALLTSPIVATVRKRVGLRLTMLLGTVLIFVSLLTSSFATASWHLFLSQGFCFGWGMGFLYISASAVLPSWFSSRRSLAAGIAAAGSGVGGLIYSIVTNSIIESLGVGWAYRILALCSLAANALSSFIIKEANGGSRGRSAAEQLAASEDTRFNPRDFGRIEVILIVIWGFATELGYVILFYSLPSYADSIGLTSSQGAIANALLNLGLALGRPLIGYISDSFGRINIAGMMTLLCTVFCFALWIPTVSLAPLLVFSLLAGALCGTFWCTITPVLVEVVGIRRLASTFGVICFALVLPTTFAEVIAMQLVKYDSRHVFLDAQLFVGFMFLTGTLSVWFLRSWKVCNMEADVDVALSSTARQTRHKGSWFTPRLLFSPGFV
jgi:MFS family permease